MNAAVSPWLSESQHNRSVRASARTVTPPSAWTGTVSAACRSNHASRPAASVVAAASMAPSFEHYGIQLWAPEVGGRIDYGAEDHEETMLALGLQS